MYTVTYYPRLCIHVRAYSGNTKSRVAPRILIYMDWDCGYVYVCTAVSLNPRVRVRNVSPTTQSQPCRASLGVICDVLECSNRPADARNRSAARFCASLRVAGISWASLGWKVMSRRKWSEILMKSSFRMFMILNMFAEYPTFFSFEKCDWHASFNFASFFRIHHKSEKRCQVERVLNSFSWNSPLVLGFDFQKHFHFCFVITWRKSFENKTKPFSQNKMKNRNSKTGLKMPRFSSENMRLLNRLSQLLGIFLPLKHSGRKGNAPMDFLLA